MPIKCRILCAYAYLQSQPLSSTTMMMTSEQNSTFFLYSSSSSLFQVGTGHTSIVIIHGMPSSCHQAAIINDNITTPSVPLFATCEHMQLFMSVCAIRVSLCVPVSVCVSHLDCGCTRGRASALFAMFRWAQFSQLELHYIQMIWPCRLEGRCSENASHHHCHGLSRHSDGVMIIRCLFSYFIELMVLYSGSFAGGMNIFGIISDPAGYIERNVIECYVR